MKKQTFAFERQTSFDEARVVLIPVPWEVTVSGEEGTASAEKWIRQASSNMDFFQKFSLKSVNHLIFFEEPSEDLARLNKVSRDMARGIIQSLNEGASLSGEQKKQVEAINQNCKRMTDWVYERSKEVFQSEKIPAVVGGDHSVSEGILRFTGEVCKGDFGLLHIDAHCDLRKSYQGFVYSHASVMFNVLHQPFPPKTLLQVGVRDFCQEEYERIQGDSRLKCYFDEDISRRLFQGESYGAVCEEIVSHLPSRVYVSLDVDGLEWSCAPATGTPVPGGLSFNQTVFLLQEIVRQGKTVIGFDVVETSVGHEQPFGLWNGNVSARLIYCLCGLALHNR